MYKVIFSDGGAQAFDVCSNELFDLILMYCQMANMDGVTAIKKIRQKI